MKSEKQILRSMNRLSPIGLGIAWVILIAVPGILFVMGFDFLLEKGEEIIKDQVSLELYSEMKDFSEDLLVENYVGRELKKATAKLIANDFEAHNIRQGLESHSGLKILGVFAHGPDTASVSVDIDPDFAGRMVVSQTMLRNFFMIHNRQLERAFINETRKARVMNNNAQAKMQSRTEAFIKNLFKFTGVLELEEGRIFSLLSGREDLGRFFLFYKASKVITHGREANAGGFMAIVRQRDIAVQSVVSSAMNRSQRSGFSRSVQYKEFKNRVDFNSFNHSISRISADAGGLALVGGAPDQLLVRLACRDTFYPMNLERLLSRFPMLRVNVEESVLHHPVRRLMKPLRLIYLVFAVASVILFLRIYMFGMLLPLRIRGKILAAVVMASLLPFMALIMISAYNNSISRDLQNFETIGHLKQKVAEFSFLTNAFRSQLELESSLLGEKMRETPAERQLPYLQEWVRNSPVTHLLVRWKGIDKLIGDEPLADNSMENQLGDILFTTVENATVKRKSSGVDDDGTTGRYGFKVKGIGEFMSEPGLTHNTSFGGGNLFYSLVPVFDKVNGVEILDLIMLFRYTGHEILRNFFATESDFVRKYVKNGFEVNSCYIPLEYPDQLPQQRDFFCSDDSVIEIIMEKARDLLLYKSQTTWTENTPDGRKRIVYADFSQGLQCMVFLVAEKKTDELIGFLPSYPIMAGYMAILVFFIFVYLGRVFIEPVRLLQRSVEEVAAGNYQQKVQIKTGDEFDRLFETYDEMLTGLNEKEKLTSYVSEDVLSEVSQDDDVLVPGGERAQVSVVFCSIAGLKKLDAAGDADRILANLGMLVDTADEVSRKYFGVIDKIIEDTIMLVFRQSDAGTSHILAACRAVLEISHTFKADNSQLRIVAGLASGVAVSGKIGSRYGKLDYTVIGNPVNLAARLKAQTHLADQTGVIICPQTIRALRGAGKLRFIDRVAIKGRTRTFPLYELLSLRSDNRT